MSLRVQVLAITLRGASVQVDGGAALSVSGAAGGRGGTEWVAGRTLETRP